MERYDIIYIFCFVASAALFCLSAELPLECAVYLSAMGILVMPLNSERTK